MTLTRKQFEKAINTLCKECVKAYIYRREPYGFLGRVMAKSNVMSFFDELVKKK